MQRYLSLISTDNQLAGMQRAHELFQHTANVLWVTRDNLPVNNSSQCLPASKARTVLGREFYLVVFDVWSGLDVNALAAVTGTIRTGGTLILLTPSLAVWPEYPDPDCQRFLPYPWLPEQVAGHFIRRFVTFLSENGAAHSNVVDAESIAATPSVFQVQTTADQLWALTTIMQTDQPIVLSADRGRGKSAVLGMVARQFRKRGQRVVLTAPARAAIASVLEHADYSVEFIAPDDLLQNVPEADALLVDEAAAIPLPMLFEMLRLYPRCIFATTLQGYEGSGRGFVLRFQRELARLYPDWQAVKLTTPIRWGEGDWLEGFVHQWLIMDGGLGAAESSLMVNPVRNRFKRKIHPSPPLLKEGGVQQNQLVAGVASPFVKGERGGFNLCVSAALQGCVYQTFSQSQLAQSEPKLREIFNLLINAHYQTRPSDLRQMLDAPHITTHTLEQQGQVVAVALLAEEGGLDAGLTAEIQSGKRRPHGHLLAQSLTFHAGIPNAACLRCQRIMRIAVMPQLQRQGTGELLLAYLQKYAVQQQADYLGVSYALSPGLLHFWQKAGFQPVRLGYRKDKASGSRSLMQVRGLSENGIELANTANQLFRQGLSELLEKLGDVSAVLADELRTPAKT